ncbi:hypothetical protein KI387_016592, partial [Taxus chinensis]
RGSAEKPSGGPNCIWGQSGQKYAEDAKSRSGRRRKKNWLGVARDVWDKRPEPAGSAEMSTGSQKRLGHLGCKGSKPAEPAEKES